VLLHLDRDAVDVVRDDRRTVARVPDVVTPFLQEVGIALRVIEKLGESLGLMDLTVSR
jgi:hypothetical protein